MDEQNIFAYIAVLDHEFCHENHHTKNIPQLDAQYVENVHEFDVYVPYANELLVTVIYHSDLLLHKMF